MLGRRNRAGGEPTSGTHHRFNQVLIGVACLVAITVLVALYPPILDVVVQEHEAGVIGDAEPSGDQVVLESSILNDRLHLFKGVLTYDHLEPMPVEQTQQLGVELIGVGENPAAINIPHGYVVGSRSLQVGGVEGASLSVRGGGVGISPVGPTRGLIGKPGDKVYWTWDITPKEPGKHTLDLLVVTYQGRSDNPLSVVNPPVRIELSVTETWSHRIKSTAGWIIGFGGFIAAVAAIFAFFREQVFALLSKLTRKRKEQQATGSKLE